MAELYPFALFLLLLLMWVALPLAPAWVTYRITPNQRLGLSGPLQGLTVRAGGAFAAYLIIFLVIASQLGKGIAIIGSVTHPAWRVSANIRVLNFEGKPEPFPSGQKLSINFNPALHRIENNRIQLRLPDDRSTWPWVTVQIASFGGSEGIDLGSLQDSAMEVDELRKTIRLKDPIIVREFRARGFGAVTPANMPGQ